MPTDTMPVVDRVQYHLARLAGRLPPRLLHLLAGGPPGEIDGSVLDDQVHLGLIVREKITPPRAEDVEGRRQQTRRDARITSGPPLPVAAVEELWVEGADGPLAARLYRPRPATHSTSATRRPDPLLVWLHGGGYVIGDLDTADQPARMLCRHADLNVLSVDYRLAPEHPFPAPLEDAMAAFRWAVANAEQLGADPERVAIGGDSAGANLATVASRLLRDAGGPVPAAQLLVYPPTDMASEHPSKDRFADGYFLTAAEASWFADHYCDGADLSDPRLSPLLAEDLSGLPPALLVTAAFDLLRDEGEAYAAAMRDAGTPVVLRRVPRVIHAFMNTTGINQASYDATVGIAAAFRTILEVQGTKAC